MHRGILNYTMEEYSERLTQKDLDSISHKIKKNEYMSLARQLEVDDSDVERIERDYANQDTKETVYQILKFWLKKCDERTSRNDLIEALSNIEKHETAELLKIIPGLYIMSDHTYESLQRNLSLQYLSINYFMEIEIHMYIS